MPSLQINLSSIIANYQALQAKAGNIAAVVKADAYGLGATKIATALQNAGCSEFYVATLNEALALQPHIDASIYVFNGITDDNASEFANNNIIPVLNNLPQLQAWQQASQIFGKALPCTIHVDTGMHRLGFAGMPMYDGVKPTYILSHLACADTPKHELNKQQLELFKKYQERFKNVKYSLANSAGVMLGEDYYFDQARCGIALYGGMTNMQPAVQLTAQIIQINELTQSSYIGYGATAKLPKNSKTATINIGYADGILRQLSNKGSCYIDGHKVPYVGRVSMDLIIIDITSLPEHLTNIGQPVEVLGNNYTINHMADDARTIPYEIITRLGNRFDKEYIIN